MATRSKENGEAQMGPLKASDMQSAMSTCQTHTSEVIDMYCSTCGQPHCLQCIKANHIVHDWDKLSKIAQKFRNEATTRCQTIKNNTIPEIEGYLVTILKARRKLSKESLEKMSKMKVQRDKILSVIDAKIDENISNLNENAEKLKKIESELRSDLADLGQCADMLEQYRLTASDNVIMDLANKLDVKIAHTPKIDLGNLPKCQVFIRGELKTDELKLMLGNIIVENEIKNDADGNGQPFIKLADKMSGDKEPPPLKNSDERSDFKHGEKEISAICQADDACAWVLKQNNSKIEMLTLDGKPSTVGKDLKTKVSDFVISKTGDFIYTAYKTCSINSLSSDGKITKIYDATPLHPEAIDLCTDGDILTALIDNYDYSTDKKSTRLVRRITMTGDVKTTYQYLKKLAFLKKTNLFTVPVSVCENKNSNICVVDRTASRSGRLCVLLKDGGVKFTYSGQKLKKSFCPLYVICDPKCNIIVTDWENSSIYLLGPDGQFLKFIATADTGLKLPRSLCLYKKNLWVGCHYGNIKLIQYLT